METNQQSLRSWITDGITIAGITATAYFVSLIYELAFCEYFGIPSNLISLSSTTILCKSVGMFLILGVLYSVLSTACSTGLYNLTRPIIRIIFMILALVMALGTQYMLFGKLWKTNMWMFSVVVLLGSMVSILFLLRGEFSINIIVSLIFSVVLYSIISFYMAGHAAAKYKEGFFCN